MAADKATEFFDALIVLTKSGKLDWENTQKSVQFYQKNGDTEHSYMTMFEGQLIFLVRNKTSGDISCVVEAWGLPPEQIGETNAPTLMKLYNLINGIIPSIDAFVDAVILEAKAST